MDPLQTLKETGDVDESFVSQAEQIIEETGRSYESVFVAFKFIGEFTTLRYLEIIF